MILDPHAFVRLLRSELPIALFPAATGRGAFDYSPHNSFWKLPDLKFISEMDPPLRNYLRYAFSRSQRLDFLRMLEESPKDDSSSEIIGRPHNIWETAIWIEVSGRKLVSRSNGESRILKVDELKEGDTFLTSELWPCEIEVANSGEFNWRRTDGHSNFAIYHRADPNKNEAALRQALPILYQPFSVEGFAKEPPNRGLGGAVDLGGGWKWLRWFGYFNDEFYPWINHKRLGWLHLSGNNESVYFNSSKWGLLWTKENLFPVLYRFRDKRWILYDLESDESVSFHDLTKDPR